MALQTRTFAVQGCVDFAVVVLEKKTMQRLLVQTFERLFVGDVTTAY